MEEQYFIKEKFLVDGTEVEGYVIDDRDYGKVKPVRFTTITTNGKFDGVKVFYQLEPEIFTLNYPKNELCDFGIIANILKNGYFEYENKLYIKYIFDENSKYFVAYTFDNPKLKELFKNNKSKYKKLNRIQSFFCKLLNF